MFVVTYHNVLGGEPDALDWPTLRLAQRDFAREMAYLASHFHPVSLAELLRQLERGGPDPRAVAVTFDDGYYGVLAHALPVLSRLGIPASVFVLTAHCGAPAESELPHFNALEVAFWLTRREEVHLRSWGDPPQPITSAAGRDRCLKIVKDKLQLAAEADRRRWLEEVLDALAVTPREILRYAASEEKFRMLTWEELGRLAEAGITIGSHTRSHRTLSRLGPRELDEEIAGACADLRSRLGLVEIPLAYPYGGQEHVGAAARELARRVGHSCGLSTIPGCNTPSTDRFLLHRVHFRELRRRRPRPPRSPGRGGGRAEGGEQALDDVGR